MSAVLVVLGVASMAYLQDGAATAFAFLGLIAIGACCIMVYEGLR